MDREDARRLARRLMDEHGLRGWGFGFNHARRRLGVCRYDRRRIELSRHLVDHNEEPAIRETVLHEIAHAIAGVDAGHGPRWKAICLRVGAKPQRLDRDATMPTGRWRSTCVGCGQRHSRHRRPLPGRVYHCRRCGPSRGRLRFRDHGPGAVAPAAA